MERKVHLILDSGAFSAWKKQEDLDVHAYAEFIKRHERHFVHQVNLDKIPGSWGVPGTAADVENSARISWENSQVLAKAGIATMPVYHQGERRYWLEKMVEQFDYVGISPANDRTPRQKREWLDEVFNYLCGREGFPKVKTHAFGMTSMSLLYRYPWYSADSVSWILFGSYGMILVPPRGADGAYDYSVTPEVVHVSHRSKQAKHELSQNVIDNLKSYDTMGPVLQRYVDEYLESEGYKVETMRNIYDQRKRINCRFFIRTSQYLTPRPYKASTGLFGTGAVGVGQSTCVSDKFHMVFTSGGFMYANDKLLTDEGAPDRLISYYHIRDQEGLDEQFAEYVQNGFLAPRERVKRASTKRKVHEPCRSCDEAEEG